MSVPLLFFFFWYQIGIILVRMALAVSPYVNAVQPREPVSGAHVCLFVCFFKSVSLLPYFCA